MLCSFCRKNGETPTYYKSHNLKNENNQVTCPVLKEFICPLCKVKGKHTVSYCPKKFNSKKKTDKTELMMMQWAQLVEQLIKMYLTEMNLSRMVI